MHPDPAFRMDDAAIRAFAAARAFAHIFASGPAPAVVHAPVVITPAGHLRFHLSARNEAADRMEGAAAIASIAGPDAYVSPDWYGTGDQVPTWNYVAVEAHGRLRRLTPTDTIAQLDAASAAHEARLSPKRPWTREKMSAGGFEAMTTGIVGYELVVADWRGTAKASQNKPAALRARIAAALARQGEHAMARVMEDIRP